MPAKAHVHAEWMLPKFRCESEWMNFEREGEAGLQEVFVCFALSLRKAILVVCRRLVSKDLAFC